MRISIICLSIFIFYFSAGAQELDQGNWNKESMREMGCWALSYSNTEENNSEVKLWINQKVCYTNYELTLHLPETMVSQIDFKREFTIRFGTKDIKKVLEKSSQVQVADKISLLLDYFQDEKIVEIIVPGIAEDVTYRFGNSNFNKVSDEITKVNADVEAKIKNGNFIFRSVDDAIEKASLATSIALQDPSLKDLQEIGNTDLPALTTLSISGDDINPFPHLSGLKALKKLEINFWRKELPKEIGDMVFLEELKIDGEYTGIPVEMKNLTKLRVLSLDSKKSNKPNKDGSYTITIGSIKSLISETDQKKLHEWLPNCKIEF